MANSSTQTHETSLLADLGRYLVAQLLVALSTFLAFWIAYRWGSAAVEMIYLPAVLAAGTWWGFGPAVLAAVTSALLQFLLHGAALYAPDHERDRHRQRDDPVPRRGRDEPARGIGATPGDARRSPCSAQCNHRGLCSPSPLLFERGGNRRKRVRANERIIRLQCRDDGRTSPSGDHRRGAPLSGADSDRHRGSGSCPSERGSRGPRSTHSCSRRMGVPPDRILRTTAGGHGFLARRWTGGNRPGSEAACPEPARPDRARTGACARVKSPIAASGCRVDPQDVTHAALFPAGKVSC